MGRADSFIQPQKVDKVPQRRRRTVKTVQHGANEAYPGPTLNGMHKRGVARCAAEGRQSLIAAIKLDLKRNERRVPRGRGVRGAFWRFWLAAGG
jgi:hypothetical protein